MWILLFCILLAIGVFCLLAPISFRFHVDDKIKKAAVGYLLLSFEVDLIARQLVLWCNGYAVKRIDQTTPRYEKYVKPVVDRAERAAGRRFNFQEMYRNGQRYLRTLFWFVQKFTVNYLNFHIAGGFADPYYTGGTYAAYSVASGILPAFMSHITYRPDFSADTFTYSGRGKISIRVVHLVHLGWRILKEIAGTKYKERFIIRKKGVSYG